LPSSEELYKIALMNLQVGNKRELESRAFECGERRE
jgi:hypothetical protein